MKRSVALFLSLGMLFVLAGGMAAGACDTALLVIDMQTYYLSNAMLATCDGLAILPRVAATIDAARDAGILVIYGKNLDPRLEEDDPALGFPELIAPMEEDFVILKREPNAFEDTTLEEILDDAGVTRLLICGIWSTCCVKGTIPAAKGRMSEVIVVADAHADSVARIEEIKALNDTWSAMEGVTAIRLSDIDFESFCP